MRKATIDRNTNETQIRLSINLDGNGTHNISTGVGFLDHMLEIFAVHSGFDLNVFVKGDLEVDSHHTIEDVGIVLGKAFAKASEDKTGLTRYGSFILPMDEVLVFSAVDISGRPFIMCDVPLPDSSVGSFDCEMLPEFMRAFAMNSGITLHLKLMYGVNKHHIIEGCFKSLAHSLKIAAKKNDSDQILSSKGVI
ncbi:MAG: imidazoleglycerol-phosphate dehydratase HisB [Clostridia bacterium]